MAISTARVARSSTMAIPALFSLVCFLAALASAQSIAPSNSTLPDDENNSLIELALSGAPFIQISIAPLTSAAGRGMPTQFVTQIYYKGTLKSADARNQSNIGTGDIVIVSCDPSTGFLQPAAILSSVVMNDPLAIVLYSTTSMECNVAGDFAFGSLFTTIKAVDALGLYNAVVNYPTGPNLLSATVGTNETSSSGSSNTSDNSSSGGAAPTTAVAMSILYSITGIITLLFLIIIATGAIRAHRHPERYGPRTGHLGRSRQSRAKGLARAMLETLPIVKFGDPEPVKPGSRDIELEDGTSVHSRDLVVAPEATGAVGDEKTFTTIPESAALESGMHADTQAKSIKSGEAPAPNDGELGCSICTEDFTTGEDVRVLPCKHKYHPACIDPWLLNVSGTCPLCRHDLRPAATIEDITAEGDELPPPLSATEAGETAEVAGAAESADTRQGRRHSRFLDLHRLRTAPAEERIAALRRLREQSQQEGHDAAEDAEEPTRRARITGRLRDTFRIRTRRQNEEPQQPEASNQQ